MNTEFIFFNSVRSSLQPVRKAIACWKSGQPIQCANYIFALSLADLHVLSQHSSLCSRYFCSLHHSLTYMRLAEQPTQQLVFYISVQNLLNMARTKKTPKNLPAKKKSRSGKGLVRRSRRHGVPKAGPTSNGITGKNNGSQSVPAARQQ